MSMTEPRSTRNKWQRWSVPAVCVMIAIVYLIVGLLGGQPELAIAGPAIMLATAALFMLAARFSETVRGLRDRNDERLNAIDRDATLIAGVTVFVAVLILFVVDVARGHDGQPYATLGALGGVSYLLALLWGRLRR